MCLCVEESVDHLLLNCMKVYEIWTMIRSWFDCNWVLPYGIGDLFDGWQLQIGVSRGRTMWSLSFFLLFGYLEGKKP